MTDNQMFRAIEAEARKCVEKVAGTNHEPEQLNAMTEAIVMARMVFNAGFKQDNDLEFTVYASKAHDVLCGLGYIPMKMAYFALTGMTQQIEGGHSEESLTKIFGFLTTLPPPKLENESAVGTDKAVMRIKSFCEFLDKTAEENKLKT